jgi:hypothetical protein
LLLLLTPQVIWVGRWRRGIRRFIWPRWAEDLGQTGQAAVLQCLDRAGGLTDCGRYLRSGQPADRAQQQHLALIGGELLEGGHHAAALQALNGQYFWVLAAG